MSIWFKNYTLQELRSEHEASKNIASLIGIEITDFGDDYITARMPVDERTRMPLGLLHGGASCVLAESLGSYASFLCIDRQQERMVGLEINANHIKGVSSGYVTGTVRPVHLGRRTHVWDIRIETEDTGALVCVSRLTVAILPAKASG